MFIETAFFTSKSPESLKTNMFAVRPIGPTGFLIWLSGFPIGLNGFPISLTCLLIMLTSSLVCKTELSVKDTFGAT